MTTATAPGLEHRQAALDAALAACPARLREDGCVPAPPFPPRADLALLLRTDTVLSLPVASMVAASLAVRLRLPPRLQQDLFTALQEALTNAALHGNLGLESTGRDTTEGFDRFITQVERRLRDPACRARPVLLACRWQRSALRVEVTDCGAMAMPRTSRRQGGRDIAGNAARPHAHGRGLALIRALTQHCAWQQRRHTLAMRFTLP